jgi:hypothetical protein
MQMDLGASNDSENKPVVRWKEGSFWVFGCGRGGGDVLSVVDLVLSKGKWHEDTEVAERVFGWTLDNIGWLGNGRKNPRTSSRRN